MKQNICGLGLLILLTISFQANCQNRAAQRHEFVKRQNANNEMALGNYTVLAVSTSEANAKQTADEIQKSGYTDIAFGYLTVKKSWYIYVSSGDDVEKARATRDKYSKTERFKDAWILTVHE